MARRMMNAQQQAIADFEHAMEKFYPVEWSADPRHIKTKFRETKYPHKRSEGLRRTGKQKKLDRLMFETGEKR